MKKYIKTYIKYQLKAHFGFFIIISYFQLYRLLKVYIFPMSQILKYNCKPFLIGL